MNRLLKAEQVLLAEKAAVKVEIKTEKANQDDLQKKWKEIVKSTESLQKELQVDIPALRKAAQDLALNEPLLHRENSPKRPVSPTLHQQQDSPLVEKSDEMPPHKDEEVMDQS